MRCWNTKRVETRYLGRQLVLHFRPAGRKWRTKKNYPPIHLWRFAMLLRVNGITLNVEQSGTGRPLLLLHGFTGSAATWAPLIGALPLHFHMIAPDLIGHGRSDSPPDAERYRMERCVADLLALLDALGVERTDVLGYSMGGRVALHLAAAAPGRFRSLILESSSPGI